jgi:hypothetical protein
MASASRGVEAARRTAESPSDVLSVLGKVYGDSYMGFEQNLATQGEQAYERRQGALMGALNQFAGYETERWQYNELYPYMQKMQAAGEMAGAGGANVSGGLNMGMQTFGTQADIKQQNNMFDQWKTWQKGSMGGGQAPTEVSRNWGMPEFSPTNYRTQTRAPWQKPGYNW